MRHITGKSDDARKMKVTKASKRTLTPQTLLPHGTSTFTVFAQSYIVPGQKVGRVSAASACVGVRGWEWAAAACAQYTDPSEDVASLADLKPKRRTAEKRGAQLSRYARPVVSIGVCGNRRTDGAVGAPLRLRYQPYALTSTPYSVPVLCLFAVRFTRSLPPSHLVSVALSVTAASIVGIQPPNNGADGEAMPCARRYIRARAPRSLPLDYTIAPQSKLGEDESEEIKSNENPTHKKFMRTLQLVRTLHTVPRRPLRLFLRPPTTAGQATQRPVPNARERVSCCEQAVSLFCTEWRTRLK
jgi:hypothetical protein